MKATRKLWVIWFAQICRLVQTAVERLEDASYVASFVEQHIEPIGAVAVFFLRHPAPKALEKVGSDATIHVLFGAVAEAPVEEAIPLEQHFYSGEGVERVVVYYRSVRRVNGRLFDPPAWRELRMPSDWEWDPLLDWLTLRSYPSVNIPIRGTFPAPKYIQDNKYGLVLATTKHLMPSTRDNERLRALAEELLPWARMYRRRFKFSLFPCVPETAEVCDRLGLRVGSSETGGYEGIDLVLAERPADMPQGLAIVGSLPNLKFRLTSEEIQANPGAINEFFERYAEGRLLPHYVSLPERPHHRRTQRRISGRRIPDGGVCELTAERLNRFFSGGMCGEQDSGNSKSGALVLFWTSMESTQGNGESSASLSELWTRESESEAYLVEFEQLTRNKDVQRFANLGILDCTRNEHPYVLPALPWVRWFPRRGEPMDVHGRSASALADFLDDRREDALENGEL